MEKNLDNFGVIKEGTGNFGVFSGKFEKNDLENLDRFWKNYQRKNLVINFKKLKKFFEENF